LLLSAVLRTRAAAPLSIDIAWTYSAQQQTRSTPRLRLNDGTLDRFRSTV